MGLAYNIFCPWQSWLNELGAVQPNTNSCDFNFFIIGLFFIYFFRISKWNIAGPILKFNAKPELGWWREVLEGETYSQTGKPEPLAVGENKTITLNLVDCLSCGHQVPVRSEKCMQCGAPYLISADN